MKMSILNTPGASQDDLRQRNFAVTGATGFVGRHLVNDLLSRGANVAILVRDRSQVPFKPHQHLQVIEGDLSDQEALKKLVAQRDILLHLAAYVHLPDLTPEQKDRSYQINYLGTKRLLDTCLENEHPPFFLFLSSVSVYGNLAGEASENQACHPETVYGQAKLAAENYLLDQIKQGSMQGCVLRPCAILGENAPGNFSRLIRFVNLGIFPVLNRGENRKSLIYINDVVRGLLLAVEKQDLSNGQVYNLSTPEPLKILQICRIISTSLGKKVLLINLPKGPVSALLSIWDKFAGLWGGRLPLLKRSLDVITSEDVISTEKIQNQLGFITQTSAKEGIIAMVKAAQKTA